MITIDAIPRSRVFTEPILIAEVEYRAWTDDGKLRHASFKGIRSREDEAAVFQLSKGIEE
ncbi:hypothetical protein HR059_09510 [Sinorhizobium meliloti WSM1022]|uniref:ATP dependent DNA ligase n=1 Tax=Rhizobium meliloti TaxID=382 RepID=UPI0002D27CF6|nr:hypothetical protein [Sinorhizobium meliloti]QKN14695.1 hypothetical protein HR059_09510 [Sinorhizobium meliloti WSM1022]WGI72959.1 hypothetical protein QC756_11300 [Sinorhizobium meliloti]